MSDQEQRLRDQIVQIDDPEGAGAVACKSLQHEERELSELRLLLQEQITGLHLERGQRIAALRTRRKAA